MTITATLTQNQAFAENNRSVALDAVSTAHARWAQAQVGAAGAAAWQELKAAEALLWDAREAADRAAYALEDRHSRLHRTMRYLTGQEQHRLLCRLPQGLAEAVWAGEYAFQYELDDAYGEQLAERGTATRHRTTLEAFLLAHPLHTCATAPAGWSFDAEAGTWVEETCDDVPF